MRAWILALVVFFSAAAAQAESRSPVTERLIPSQGGDVRTSTHTTSQFKATAGTDTFCLYGGPGSSLGKFQDAATGLNPDNQGWIGIDVTDQPTLWQRSTFNASNLNNNGAGNHAMWAGQSAAQEPGWVTAPGYGNSWNALLRFQAPMADPSVGQTVNLDFYFNHDTEPGYDFLTVEYDSASVSKVVYSISGSNKDASNNFLAPGVQYSTTTPGAITYAGNDYPGGNVSLRMLLVSDAAWSDEDGLWPSDGGAQVDDITVTYSDGIAAQVSFENFEDAGPYAWEPIKAPFAGYFGKVFARMTDTDPCRGNISPLYGFMDDGTGPFNPSYVGTGTGGTTSLNWSYGIPGGWVVNYNGGTSFGILSLENRAASPEIVWDLPGTADDHPDIAGGTLRFSIWRHLPLQNGIFYRWEVRGREAGTGIWSPWESRNFVYFGGGGGDWLNVVQDVSDLIPNNRDRVQAGIVCLDAANLFAFAGNDATPSPAFDNVAFRKYRVGGPAISTRTIDIFQDSFSQSGNTDASTLAGRDAMDIRLDMARDISTGNANIPGDSIIVDVTPVIPGSTIDIADIKMKWWLGTNIGWETSIRGNLTSFPGVTVLAGGPGTVYHGTVAAQQSTTSGGAVVENRYFFDLPDSDFFYPGDLLHYYIEATDSDGRTSTLPANAGIAPISLTDTPASRAGDPCLTYTFNTQYKYSDFKVEGKPSIWVRFTQNKEQAVEIVHPDILMIEDGRTVTMIEWDAALGQLGYLDQVGYDRYRVMGPTSNVSNGIGSAGAHGATAAQLAGYSCVLYSGSNLTSNLLSDGTNSGQSDKGDDIGTLTWWHGQNANRAIAYFADGIATALSSSGTGSAAGDTYLATVMGVSFGDSDVRDEIGGQTAPLVTPTGAVGGFVTDYVVYGGCFGINQFDSITPIAGALKSHEWVTTPSATAAAGVIWDRVEGGFRKVDLTFPYGFEYVWNPNPKAAAGASARTELLEEILNYKGGVAPFGPVTPSPGRPLDLVVHRATPNPFNPSTEVRFETPSFGSVRATIYNLRGERVRQVLHETLPAGQHSIQWDGTDSRGSTVASGVYFLQVDGFGRSQRQKLMLLK